MARRRDDDAVNRGAMLTSLGACRDAVIREMPDMKPMGPLYHFASGVLAAIDALATFLTRDTTYFHDKGTTGYPAQLTDEHKRDRCRR